MVWLIDLCALLRGVFFVLYIVFLCIIFYNKGNQIIHSHQQPNGGII